MSGGNYTDSQAIVAASTSLQGAAGIGIVRISGFSQLESLQKLFSRDLGPIGPGRFYRTKVFDRDGKQIDDGGIVFFKAPHSYNGENILEVHLHGNPVLIRFFIQEIVELGLARHALAGEFSFRAYQNSKLNLAQVEGLDLILSSTTLKGIRQGVSSLDGELHQSFVDLYHAFLRFKSAIELNIDFLEDIGEEGGVFELRNSYDDFKKKISTLVRRCSGSVESLLKPKVVLLGKTNAGKSTLFNSLLGIDRSIVSPLEGTTRDYVSENFMLQGDVFSLIDTAGIRQTSEVIEEEGIRRAAQLFENAFYKILVINPFLPFDVDSLVKIIDIDLIVFTHADVDGFAERVQTFANFFGAVERFFYSDRAGSIGPVDLSESGPIEPAKVLSKNGPIGPKIVTGPIEPVGEIGAKVALKYQKLLKNDPLLIERQRDLILKLDSEVAALLPLLEGDIAILSGETQRVGNKLSELVGIVSPDDVLHNIFNNFCIGK